MRDDPPIATTVPALRHNRRPGRRPHLLASFAALVARRCGGGGSVIVVIVVIVTAAVAGQTAATARPGTAHGPALRVRLVELLDRVAVALYVAVAGRRGGVDAAFALLEARGGGFGGVPFVGVRVVSRPFSFRDCGLFAGESGGELG